MAIQSEAPPLDRSSLEDPVVQVADDALVWTLGALEMEPPADVPLWQVVDPPSAEFTEGDGSEAGPR